MTIYQILLILFTIFLLSAGQILFKLVSSDIDLSLGGLLPSLINFSFLIAITVYGLATILWIIALKDLPLRVAYPFAALAFFIVPTMAHFILGENLNWNTYLGAAIIALGVYVSAYQ